ncbi:acyl-CoA dehydrogenase NM domain-like protein [Favolaschia claudopus]|uniref:Acyl-CoA dehydrogenase NM domain-like protein n=1 Tax=Favolaschia claudopus TaxID=2862362 RepID=A0AAW0CUT2_9AGAR
MDPQSILAQTHLFTRAVHDFRLSKEQRQEVTHERAKAIALSFNFAVEDILTCSENFWNSTLHPINMIDGAATALWTIHVNLACGTLTPFAASHPRIQDLCRKILAFDVTAHYMLTEVGHGLDSQNIETTAKLRPDGNFELHTPTPAAAKFMPASIVAGGVPRIALVMARLVAQGRNYGIRPFYVPLNDGKSMCEGVSCRVLPDRSGTRPVGHAITSFNRVILPATALVGDLQSTRHPRIQFLASIWRLGIGSVTMAALCIPGLRMGAYITTQYAKRRKVADSQGNIVPIITFRTTQVPIIQALCEATVLEAFYKELRPYYSATADLDVSSVLNIRNGLAAVFKTLAVTHYRSSTTTLTDRLGAQGLFVENQLISMEIEMRGMSIAEGDVTVICIRLASELLLSRYSLPEPRYPNSPLAVHEKALFAEMKNLLEGMKNNHRSDEFNRLLLPRSVSLVLAIGHRMAYEAAVDARVDFRLLNLYRTSTIMHDLAWYVEHGVISRKDAFEAEDVALTEALQKLDAFVEDTGCAPCIHAPVISASTWSSYVAQLPLLGRESAPVTMELSRL